MLSMASRKLTEEVLVRMSPELKAALVADAEANGRNIAQTVRHLLAQSPAIAPQLGR